MRKTDPQRARDHAAHARTAAALVRDVAARDGLRSLADAVDALSLALDDPQPEPARMTDADRVAHARRVQGAAIDRAASGIARRAQDFARADERAEGCIACGTEDVGRFADPTDDVCRDCRAEEDPAALDEERRAIDQREARAMFGDPTVIPSEDLAAVIETDGGRSVDVLYGKDAHGEYVRLSGNGAKLAGEQPGLYYVESLSTERAERVAAATVEPGVRTFAPAEYPGWLAAVRDFQAATRELLAAWETDDVPGDALGESYGLPLSFEEVAHVVAGWDVHYHETTPEEGSTDDR